MASETAPPPPPPTNGNDDVTPPPPPPEADGDKAAAPQQQPSKGSPNDFLKSELRVACSRGWRRGDTIVAATMKNIEVLI